MNYPVIAARGDVDGPTKTRILAAAAAVGGGFIK